MIHAKLTHAALGAFSAMLAFVVGCSDSDGSPSARASQPLTVPLPTISQYVIMASRTATVGDRNNVSGGDVGVAAPGTPPNTFTAGVDSRVAVGEVLIAPRVVLRERVVAGEIGANAMEIHATATTGPRSAYLAPPARPVPTGAFNPGATPVTVNSGQTTTLAAGSFAAVNVSGILNLSGGTYTFASLRVNPDARVIALAASTVRVATGVAAADRSRLQAPAPQAAGNLRFVVNGTIDGPTNSLSLGTDVQLRALVIARNVFRTGDRLAGAGAVSGQDVILGNDAALAFNTGFGCTTAADCNDNNACTNDACVNALCQNTNAPNGTACADGNACTQTDTCQAGTCMGSNPVVCMAADQCHDAGTCNPANGTCTNPNSPNGTPCTDGNACTQMDSCQAGACVPGAGTTCPTPDQCHDPGACDPATGTCSNPAKPNGSVCNDGNGCTEADTCQAGTCESGDPVECTASDDCHEPGVCNPETGTCSNPVRPDGSACDDESACTQTDACQAGSCVGGNEVVCTASDQCHEEGTCDPATGACSDPNKPDGSACDDGSVCSIGDSCEDGVCAAGDDFAVTEFSTELTQPSSIVSGPFGRLWFVSRETTPSAADGSVASITTAGVVSATPASYRDPYVTIQGPDGLLWFGARFLGGLPVVGRFDTATSTFAPDYFLGLLVNDMAGTNDAGQPIVWLTAGSSVVRLNPAGTILSTTPTMAVARAITASAPAPTSTVWFTQAPSGGVGRIGRIQYPALSQFTVPATGELADIAVGSDGGIWFTDTGANRIARLSPDGATLAGYPIATAAAWPYGITAGPDSNLWFTMRDANKIGFITPTGEITEICIPTAASGPSSIAAGSDGNIWFTETASGKIGRVTLPVTALAETEEEPVVSQASAAEDAGCSVASRRSTKSSMLGVSLGLALLAGVRRRAASRRVRSN